MTHPLNPDGDPRKAAVLELWRALEDAGYQRPPSWQGTDAKDRVRRGLDVWVALTSDLDPQALLAAGLLWLRKDRRGFWPVPGQVLEALREEAKVHATSGDEGWGLLTRLVSRHGRAAVPYFTQEAFEAAVAAWEARGNTRSAWNDPPPFLAHEDPATAEGLRVGIEALGGWKRAASMNEDDVAANRASFRSAFERSVARARSGRALEGLARAIGARELPALPAPVPDFGAGETHPDLELVASLESELGRRKP